MICHSEMQFLEGLLKHTSVLVTYNYDGVLCEVSYKHFSTQSDRLILVSLFLLCFALDVLEVKTHALWYKLVEFLA